MQERDSQPGRDAQCFELREQLPGDGVLGRKPVACTAGFLWELIC